MARTNVRGTQIADGSAGVDLTVDVFGNLPPTNGGLGAALPSTAGNVPTSDGAGNWVSSAQSGGASKTFAFFAGG